MNDSLNLNTTTRSAAQIAATNEAILLGLAREMRRWGESIAFPIFSYIGCITNLICCVVFMNEKFRKTKMYQLLFWVSLNYALALAICIFYPIFHSVDPIISTSYSSVIYRWLIRTWVYNSFIMTGLLCNLAVSWDRYILISQKCRCFCGKIPVLALVGVFYLFSFSSFFFPAFAYRPVNFVNNTEFWTLDYTDFGRSNGFTIVRIFMFGLRDIIVWICFIFINAMLVYKTKKHMTKKITLTKSNARIDQKDTPSINVNDKTLAQKNSSINYSKSENMLSKDLTVVLRRDAIKRKNTSNKTELRITIMVIVSSCVLILGRLPYFGQLIFYFIEAGDLYKIQSTFFSFIFAFISYNLQIFSFYFFDKNFKIYIREKMSKF
jgi:hypothetical protein